MKSMSYFIIIIVQIFLLCEITNAKKKESLLATKSDPSTVKFSEVNRKCKAECTKLSKVYPCFCDLSCIEYGDCCKLFAKGCENYFEILLNHNKIKQNKNNTINETEFSSTANKNISNNLKNYTKKEHKNKTIEDFENDGKCCKDGIEPFNCFCDAQCSVNGDCCSDYNYCINHNFLNDKNIKISMGKRKILNSFEKRAFNGTQQKNNERNRYQTNNENNFSFKHLKKVLYDKFGIKPVNNSSIQELCGNVTKSLTEKGRLSSKLGLYKVPTLTPQIGMKYIKSEDFQNNENMFIVNFKGNKNFKNNSSIEYDNNLMKIAPIAANIYISSQKLE